MNVKKLLLSAAGPISALLLTSCSSGPGAPQKGSPAFYWQAARDTYAAADFTKAADHLDNLCRSESEFSPKALPWRLVLTAGIARGYTDLADNYEYGARANKANPTPFRKLVSEYRMRANQVGLAFAETYQKFETADKDTRIPIAFPFPTGSAAQPPALLKAAQGIMLTPEETDNAQGRSIQRAIILAACSAVGAPGDVAKAQQSFAGADLSVPRETFQLAMAQALYDRSQLYEARKLDQPDRMKSFCTLASDALKGVPDSKESKELKTKIQQALAAVQKRTRG